MKRGRLYLAHHGKHISYLHLDMIVFQQKFIQIIEYNGTLKLIGTWQGYWLGEIQGLKYINGFLIISTDLYVDSVLTPYICKVRLEDNGNAKLIANHWIPALNNGNYIKGESEDLAIDETFGWVVVVNVGTYKFPIVGI